MFLSVYQRTPLHIAVREGQEHTVDCLVMEGADINIKDNDGVSEAVVLVLNYSITPDLSFILLHKKRT